MKKSQFTITLGKFGQKLVKESDRDYDGFNEPVPSVRKRQLEERNGPGNNDARSFNVPVPSMSKRSSAERIGDKSIEFNSKRMRHDDSAMGYGGYKQTDDDSRIGPNDLRVKLMQKEISRRAQLEIAERKKRELYEKVSRAIQSAEQEGVRQRKTTLSRIVDEPCQMDTKRSTYASPMLNGERTRSPDRVVRYSDGISNHMNRIDERPPQVAPLRQLDAPRPGPFFITDPVDSTRMSVPLPTTSRAPLDSGRMVSHLESGRVVMQLPLGTGGMSRPSYPDNPVTLSGMSRPPYQDNQSQPVTVSSLLHTIGLGKYAITFQAEEIDMLALRQMGDSDLKEMGIPMGPRKKILHAVEAHTKRLIAQARGNYRQSIEFAR